MLSGGSCAAQRETRYLRDGLCFGCSKTKTKIIVNVPTSYFLNARALTQLPQKQEIGPDDSLSMIGVKRQRELMEGEYNHDYDIFEDELASGQR
jgi:hypothetical protein